jgi:hypothetical protein
VPCLGFWLLRDRSHRERRRHARYRGMGAAAPGCAEPLSGTCGRGGEGGVIVSARPDWRGRDRCGVCRCRSAGYELGGGRRRWRALDPGDEVRVRRGRRAASELPPPRGRGLRRAVGCAMTRGSRPAFEDRVCWLALNPSRTAVAGLMGVAWRTVGGIIERVAGGCSARGGSARRAQTDRDRRDRPPQRSAVADRCRGPAHRPAGVGRRVATAARCSRSSTSWGKSAANRSNWYPPTRPPGSLGRSHNASPRPSGAWIGSTS